LEEEDHRIYKENKLNLKIKVDNKRRSNIFTSEILKIVTLIKVDTTLIKTRFMRVSMKMDIGKDMVN
jgi:hypothetical protein